MSGDRGVVGTRNPHRVGTRRALLPAHPVRPSVATFGFALTAGGIVFMLQQLGVITMGPVRTFALAGALGAMILGGIALGWARRAASDESNT